ncbi:prolipoprotein diacylglyceryl transferase [Taylorella equigenitalis]|uniref:Phosphatidylglycerol--prolipoprotein diacylglyceryl transferase n=2 Tax=Taylorella equigenitalis TaxID=29575 RepID=I7IZ44_9BURK|nr:prolipoprotein diacylglyceryl transferase [Taylorella equigenitalis]AFN35486.1 prolipoprotein diacylglyceryl transferase [Taylorella equigenitalis ATCC 35865]ASY30140.1 prolipoprotein diacylglyceryl transferase [Taylorella equigenitalis]ASY37446.1 prolipoprotein diacylglyceryl transferase [Taylorella equigenitalis]ASY38915.1 prolipoprotein diacylglyceryl transferase [Taylorella equigenitalis]ASY40435.1 prolipoprotein diacylglyceryl transferase [Taylorella equigenitalis]
MLTYPQIDPVAIDLGFIKVHWYGIMYLVGFFFAWLLGRYRIKKGYFNISFNRFEDLLFWSILGVVFGGRLGYVLFYNPVYYFWNPQKIFAFWDGGMAFHGGLIGVTIAMAYFAYKEKKHFLEVTDFVSPLVPLGLAFGRLGNFINGELWGRVTDVPWAMIFPGSDGQPRHPSQLYQMMGEGFLLFLIVWIYSSKPRLIGKVSGLFVMGYGVFRFLAEFAREPDRQLGYLAFGLSMGQWLSVPMILLGLIVFLRPLKRMATRGPSQDTVTRDTI